MAKKKRQLRWLRLDNAAKIYPAARRRNWSNLFRLSAELTEPVDKEILQSALDVTVRRFPSLAARLRRGMFWYYLQELEQAPKLSQEYSYPLVPMSKEEAGRCAFRVICHENRIAVEVFHCLTDGNGALVFLKTLVCEYLQQTYGAAIPNTCGILDRAQAPCEEELEDSFQKYAGNLSASRKERTAWHLSGTPETSAACHVTCLQIPSKQLLEKAHAYGVTATAYLTAVLMDALQRMQQKAVPIQKKRRPIRILIPVNLRKIFPSQTLRNFALYTTPEILPQLGEYSMEEICTAVKHHMGLEINAKQMSMKIAVNVESERPFIIRLMPLFVKNAVMKAVFNAVGEVKSCLTLSNLGAVQVPEEMKPYIKRMDFILGVQAAAPYNCGVLSLGDTVYMNFIRNIKESDLEYHFCQILLEQGIDVTAESNGL